jgi:hypothetical protein
MQMGLKKAVDTLSAAESLLEKLGGEKASWESQVHENSRALQRLPACAALAAAFVTYAPAESEESRARLMAGWRALDGIDLPQDFDVLRFLSSESELLQWKSQGLQGDRVRRFYLDMKQAQNGSRLLLFDVTLVQCACSQPGWNQFLRCFAEASCQMTFS